MNINVFKIVVFLPPYILNMIQSIIIIHISFETLALHRLLLFDWLCNWYFTSILALQPRALLKMYMLENLVPLLLSHFNPKQLIEKEH